MWDWLFPETTTQVVKEIINNIGGHVGGGIYR